MARRRSNRKGGAGNPLKKLILLIVVAIAAMFSYQPLTNALQRGDWRGALTQVKEQLDAANRQPDSHTDLTTRTTEGRAQKDTETDGLHRIL